jgi:hypothetical protein
VCAGLFTEVGTARASHPGLGWRLAAGPTISTAVEYDDGGLKRDGRCGEKCQIDSSPTFRFWRPAQLQRDLRAEAASLDLTLPRYLCEVIRRRRADLIRLSVQAEQTVAAERPEGVEV